MNPWSGVSRHPILEENGGRVNESKKLQNLQTCVEKRVVKVRNSMMTQYHQETRGKIPKRRNEKEEPIKPENLVREETPHAQPDLILSFTVHVCRGQVPESWAKRLEPRWLEPNGYGRDGHLGPSLSSHLPSPFSLGRGRPFRSVSVIPPYPPLSLLAGAGHLGPSLPFRSSHLLPFFPSLHPITPYFGRAAFRSVSAFFSLHFSLPHPLFWQGPAI